MKKKLLPVLTLLLVFVIVTVALAEDGNMFRRNVSKTPAAQTGKASVFMMDFYVPAQASDGTVGPVDNYYLDDGDLNSCDPKTGEGCTAAYEPRTYAKPLISVYIDTVDHEEEADTLSILSAESPAATATGVVFGAFDSFVSYSLDDGTTWRNENISRHGDLSSFTLENGEPFPGMSHGLVHQVAEDKILMVWASKFCDSGYPLYSLVPEENVEYLNDLEATYGKNALYLYDFFGVSGNQGSVDYTLQGWPEVGEIPYSCIWTARGKLLPGDDPMTAEGTNDDGTTSGLEASHIVWFAPERLTSGRRDANLPAVDCAGGAGCALTWQEDPEGLRPGKGLGPGEGWSGAIANAKTDIWYSYITFADFDLAINDADGDGSPDPGEAMLIEEYEAAKTASGETMDRPKPYVPMAMPVRLTDNDMCRATASTNNKPEDPFCWVDFDDLDRFDPSTITAFFDNLTAPEAGADFCASTVQWTNPGGTTLDICVTEDGRWMIGRVGSTRVRMILKPYTPAGAPDHDGDGTPDKSAWLSMGAEETKALGITVPDEETYDPVDIGKDMYYFSFDYAKPYNLHVNTTLDAVDSSPFVVQQGGMLNQPAMCSPWFITTDQTHPDVITACQPGDFFLPQVDPITLYPYYLTEISRRFALTLNNAGNITDPAAGGAGLSGMLIYKQGIIWQGGPADIMLRRTLVDPFCADVDADGVWDTEPCFNPAEDNPYAYEQMECVNPDGTSGWAYLPGTDGRTGTVETNPNYLQGLCMAPAINISGTTIKECTVGTDNDTCAAAFPVADDGTIPDELKDSDFPKVLEWRNCDGVTAIEGCDNANDPAPGDLDDQSWENPYDMAKGHRGFLYGDMVMMMYAWSPNWQANAKGNDHYNLYQRRSFDGGATWTTTPSDWCAVAADGTNICGAGTQALEYYYGATTEKIGDYLPVLWEYLPGQFEQARNMSLLIGNKVTVLDPRYSPGGGLKQYATIRTDWLTNNGLTPSDTLPYPDDLAIDASKYIVIYETGDNTVDYDVSAAVPLDLFYSRATVFGDTFEWFDYANDDLDCTVSDEVTGICLDTTLTVAVQPRFPWLENAQDDLSGEASVVLSPGGTFAYQVWNQWKQELLPDGHELIYDSDSIFRRLMWLPDDSTLEVAPAASILYLSSPVITAGLDTDTSDGVFTGLVEAIDGDKWTIGNFTVYVTDETEIQEGVERHSYVKVKFDLINDTMVAYEIELEDDDDLIFAGSGKAFNHGTDANEIVKYQWSWKNNFANLCELDLVDDDGDGLVECEQVIQMKAHQIPTNTLLTITLEVQDSFGKWSNPVTFTVKVGDGNFYVMMPMMSR